MKAELLVNLKTYGGIQDKGSVFNDEDGPFPDFITRNLHKSNIVRVTGEAVTVETGAEAVETAEESAKSNSTESDSETAPGETAQPEKKKPVRKLNTKKK